MDEIVRQAMQNGPTYPIAMAGWGWMRVVIGACAMTASSLFGASPVVHRGAKGVRLAHDKLIAFIGRNYAADARRCWYFQNGPQRVYVELEITPWVYRHTSARDRTDSYRHRRRLPVRTH